MSFGKKAINDPYLYHIKLIDDTWISFESWTDHGDHFYINGSSIIDIRFKKSEHISMAYTKVGFTSHDVCKNIELDMAMHIHDRGMEIPKSAIVMFLDSAN